jgi:GNAT superfamily N-acetyltransferase
VPARKLERSQVIIELLKAEHSDTVKSFSCGRKDEDDFLHNDALLSQAVKLSETYLLFEKDNMKKIISYVTITVGAFQIAGDRKFHNVKIMKKPYKVYSGHMPCLLIGKLATDKSEVKRGGATHLAEYALRKALDANLPIPFIALHAYPDMVNFYKKIGFRIAFTPKKNALTVTMYVEIPPEKDGDEY